VMARSSSPDIPVATHDGMQSLSIKYQTDCT